MNLLEINFTPYIPTTLFGLIGLLFAYFYGFYRNRNNNKLEQIKSVPLEERSKVAEMMLNDLGVQIKTDSLTPKQKFDLVVKLIASKNRRYLIIAITSTVLSGLIVFLIRDSNKKPIAMDDVIPRDSTENKKDSTPIIIPINEPNFNPPSTKPNESNLKRLINTGRDFPKDVRQIDRESLATWESRCISELKKRDLNSVVKYDALKAKFHGNLEPKIIIDTLLYLLQIQQ